MVKEKKNNVKRLNSAGYDDDDDDDEHTAPRVRLSRSVERDWCCIPEAGSSVVVKYRHAVCARTSVSCRCSR